MSTATLKEATSPSLIELLAEVPDFRRPQGQRYPLPALLVIILLAILSGHYGYREIARFLRAHAPTLRAQLGLKRPQMPTHVTIRTVLQHVDFDALQTAFRTWAAAQLPSQEQEPQEQEQEQEPQPASAGPERLWIALDAKAIRSTLSDYTESYQDFVCLVSAFAQHKGLVLASARYQNKQGSELEVTRELIEELVEALDLQGALFTLDALHCKKNAAEDLPKRQ